MTCGTAESSKVSNLNSLQKSDVSKFVRRKNSSTFSTARRIDKTLELFARPPQSYSDWKQVAGYFDGDGNVNVKIMKFTLLFGLDWTDTDENHVGQLKQFLAREGVRSPSILASRRNIGRISYDLRIAAIESVLKVAESMLPFSFKKSYELRLCIAYLRDQISGKETIMCLNKLVRAGIRSGAIRKAQHLSFTHSEGVRLAQLNSSKAAAVVNSVLNDVQKEGVKRMYDSGQFGLTSLARKFGVSKNTILRIVGKQPKRSLKIV